MRQCVTLVCVLGWWFRRYVATKILVGHYANALLHVIIALGIRTQDTTTLTCSTFRGGIHRGLCLPVLWLAILLLGAQWRNRASGAAAKTNPSIVGEDPSCL